MIFYKLVVRITILLIIKFKTFILNEKADFFVDNNYVIEIGGKNKGTNQISNLKNAFIFADDIEIGY